MAEDEKELEIVRPYPPLGLLYVSAYLVKNDIRTELFDSTFETQEVLKATLLKSKPEIVAFYTNLMTKVNVIKLIRWIKSQKELSGTHIVLGGPDLTYNIENYLATGANFLVLGEGEETMLALVSEISKPVRNFNDISGIAFIEDHKVIITDAREKLKSLAELPWPNRGDIPLNKYLKVWKDKHGKKTTNISTQRGCPYTCKWCSTAVYGQSYRRRPAADVVAEIQHLKNELGVEALWFVDDVFTVSHKWLTELYNLFKKQDLTIPFEIITRAERLNDDVLNQLKEMGCFRIWIGAESGSQKIIDAMDRKVDVEVVREMIIKTKQFGMEAGTFIMVGYPGETILDIKETYHHLRVSKPNMVTVTKAYPIKGTTLYTEIESTINTNNDWFTSTDRDIDFKRKFSSSFYDLAIRFIMNGYYSKTSKSLLKSILHGAKAQLALTVMYTYQLVSNAKSK